MLYMYTQCLLIFCLITHKKMENSKVHIRHCLLYEFKLGHNASETMRNICKAVEDGLMSTSTVCRWFDRFRKNDF